jgi:hypothetical protein
MIRMTYHSNPESLLANPGFPGRQNGNDGRDLGRAQCMAKRCQWGEVHAVFVCVFICSL